MNEKKFVPAGKKIAVLGMGMSGRSAAGLLLDKGAFVHGIDRNSNLLTHPEIGRLKEKGLQFSLEADFQAIREYDLVVLSPGISQDHFLIQIAKEAKIPVIGEIELGCQMIENSMIGITGTNGKTTVALLVTHILQQCGRSACALGNVGASLTKQISNLYPHDLIVLELSSYQIETLYKPCLDTAVILNITPDHLDRYKNMEAYAEAKCRILRVLKNPSSFYMGEEAYAQYNHLLDKTTVRLYGYQPSSFIYTDLFSLFCKGQKVFEIPPLLRGKKSHDLENFLAAYALCAEREIKGEEFLKAWHSFKKPSHRIEFIGEYQGVSYYDDSKGTNVDSVIRAVESIDRPIILIAGGVDKGGSYTPWIEKFKGRVKSICAIGEAAAKIEEQLKSHIPVIIFTSFDEAIYHATCLAKKGDCVLLSPGCASFDMFRDYAHRGEEFQRIVHQVCCC